MFSDTDSLIYEIKTKDVYKDFSSDKEIFGFSNYLTKSKHWNDSNKLVIGKMKDETADVVIKEFVESKPEMYSLMMNIKKQRAWIVMPLKK